MSDICLHNTYSRAYSQPTARAAEAACAHVRPRRNTPTDVTARTRRAARTDRRLLEAGVFFRPRSAATRCAATGGQNAAWRAKTSTGGADRKTKAETSCDGRSRQAGRVSRPENSNGGSAAPTPSRLDRLRAGWLSHPANPHHYRPAAWRTRDKGAECRGSPLSHATR